MLLRPSTLPLYWTEGKKTVQYHCIFLHFTLLYKREWISIKLWCSNKLSLFLEKQKHSATSIIDYSDIIGSWERTTSWNFKFYKIMNLLKNQNNHHETEAKWKFDNENIIKILPNTATVYFSTYIELDTFHFKKLTYF